MAHRFDIIHSMPITKSAIKKMRVDKRRTRVNAPILAAARSAIKKARLLKSVETINTLYSNLDKAVAHKLISKNRAARLKSRIVNVTKK